MHHRLQGNPRRTPILSPDEPSPSSSLPQLPPLRTTQTAKPSETLAQTMPMRRLEVIKRHLPQYRSTYTRKRAVSHRIRDLLRSRPPGNRLLRVLLQCGGGLIQKIDKIWESASIQSVSALNCAPKQTNVYVTPAARRDLRVRAFRSMLTK